MTSLCKQGFREHHAVHCANLEYDGLDPYQGELFEIWEAAWNLGQDIAGLSADERAEAIENEFEAQNRELATLSLLRGSSYRKTQAWSRFNAAVKLSLEQADKSASLSKSLD